MNVSKINPTTLLTPICGVKTLNHIGKQRALGLVFLLFCGILMASCGEQKPLTTLEKEYFNTCLDGGLELAEQWSTGFSGDIRGEEKASRLRRISQNAEKKCKCQAKAYSEVLTVNEYRKAIKGQKAWSAAYAGRGADEQSKDANWVGELTPAKLEELSAIEQRCPGLLDGVGPGT